MKPFPAEITQKREINYKGAVVIKLTKIILILFIVFSFIILTACGSPTTSFDIWKVPNKDIPTYKINEQIEIDEGILGARIESKGSGETAAKQVLADFIEGNRTRYKGISVRINKDADNKIWGAFYAADESTANQYKDAIDLERAKEAGFPLLVFQRIK